MVCLPNERQLDALRETSNIGMGHAATALSQLTGKTINISVPRIELTDTAGMATRLGGRQQVVAAIFLRLLGDAQGNILMVFPRDTAAKILQRLLPQAAGGLEGLSELQESTLREVGNILASAYLSALGNLLHMTLLPSVPLLAIDRAGVVVEHLLADSGEVGETLLLLETEFFSLDEPLNSHFFLLPAASSLETMLCSLGIGSP